MRTTGLGLILAISVAALVTHPVPGQKGGGIPRIICPNGVWDFGRQPQYKKMTHEFVIRNEGEGELKILQVLPSCQCQAAMPEKTVLNPGEQTLIKASFDTKTMAGPIHKPITIKSNDPRRPSIQLMVHGTILPPYWLEPPEVNLGNLEKNGGAAPQEFSVVMSPGAKVGIRFVETTSDFVVVKRLSKAPVARSDGMQEIRYQVELKPGHPVGLVRERVSVTTDVREKRSVSLGINAEVRGEVRILPPTIRLGRVRRGKTPSRSVDVVKSGKPDLVIENLIIRPERAREVFAVEKVAVEEGRHYKVRISVKPDAPARFQRGHVVIMTNCPGERLHQAYFYVSIKG